MSDKDKVRLVFACGAYLLCHADDAQTEGAIGTKALVFVNDPKVSNQRPHIPEEAIIAEKLPHDARACCLLMCPAKVRESGRKVARGWFSATPDCPTDAAPVLYVTCKIKAHVVSSDETEEKAVSNPDGVVNSGERLTAESEANDGTARDCSK